MKVNYPNSPTKSKNQQKYRKKSTTLNNHVKAQAKAKSPKSKKKSTKKSSSQQGDALGFLKSQGMIQCYGIILMLFALLLFVSIFSFYFHAHNNITYVMNHGAIPSENIARSVGAYLAYGFVQSTFGVFAIGFSILFFLYGLKITFDKAPHPLLRTTFNMLATMAFLSIFFGLFFYNGENSFVSGFFGNSISLPNLP